MTSPVRSLQEAVDRPYSKPFAVVWVGWLALSIVAHVQESVVLWWTTIVAFIGVEWLGFWYRGFRGRRGRRMGATLSELVWLFLDGGGGARAFLVIGWLAFMTFSAIHHIGGIEKVEVHATATVTGLAGLVVWLVIHFLEMGREG